jgi:ribonuclease HII
MQIGVDEAGRGSVIGPLVVCALMVGGEDRGILSSIGADDSKKLSKTSRERIFKEIGSISESRGWGVGLVICSSERVDEGMVRSNLNYLESELFGEAINLAVKPNRDSTILLDACDVDADRFSRTIAKILGPKWEGCKIVSEHGMDSKDVIVGAASIIAKYVRDREIGEISESLGFDVGSGYPSDPSTRKAVRELCMGTEPHDCLRWGWATVNDTWKEIHKRPVPERGALYEGASQSTLEDWK